MPNTELNTEVVREAAREAVSELAGVKVDAQDALISSGLIDSLSILNLISRIERKLGIKLDTAGLQPDDFDNLDLIVETVGRAQV